MATMRARVLSPDPASDASDAITWIDDAFVRIEGGRLVEIRPWRGEAVDEDLRPGVLLPGFVDSHLHYPQTRIIGSASGPLLQWLQRSTFPEEARFADDDHARTVAEAFAASLASAGTTLSMVYGSVHASSSHALFDAMDRRGLRCIGGPVLMDRNSPPELTVPADRALGELTELVDRWHGHDDRLYVGVIPRFALSCSQEMMERAGALARERDLWVTTHVAETVAECRAACEMFGADDYLSIYERAGLLHERSVYAHCIHLSEDEWRRFAEARAVVAHCPDSNAFLGSGHMPTADVLRHGIRLSIGTDVAAGRSFRIPRIVSSAYDNALAVGLDVQPGTLLRWGTLDGARALGHTQVGALAVGFEADMVLMDVPAWATSAEQVLAWTLFYADAPPPRQTWVRGRTVWRREPGHAPFPWS